ncbi:MAG: hypothetical protein AB8B86_08685 [Pseudomonadales bacterium]
MALSIAEVTALGRKHSMLEGEQKLDELMETLTSNPCYEYPTIGKQFSGWENTLRFYTGFFEHFSPQVTKTQLLGEWVNEQSVTQEYDVTLEFNGKPEVHRILGILLVEGDKLGGERIYASELAIKRMVGPMFDDLIDL